MGADGVPREQAELAEMEVRAEGSRRGFSKLGGAPVRNGIPCLFREPRSCGKSFASLDAAQFRCAAEQSKKGYTRVETRKACLGAKSTRVVARMAHLEPSRKWHRRCTKFNCCSTLGSSMDLPPRLE